MHYDVLYSRAGEQVEGKDILDYYKSDKVKTFLKVCKN